MAAKKLPLDKPELLPWLRGIFFASNIGVLGCCFVIQRKISRNEEPFVAQHITMVTDLLEADTAPLVHNEQQVQEASPSAQVSTYAHDQKHLWALYKLPIKGLLVVAIMHFYMKSTKPLIIQSILPLKALWEAQIFRVHIRGHVACGELQRPWKTRKGPCRLVTEYMGLAVKLWKGVQTKIDCA